MKKRAWLFPVKSMHRSRGGRVRTSIAITAASRPACFSACQIATSVAAPKGSRLLRTLPVKMTGSCGTRESLLRRS